MNGNLSRTIDKALFNTALEMNDPETRRAFLLHTCGSDEAQFLRITAWLDTLHAADDFFRSATLERIEVGCEIGNTQPLQPSPRDLPAEESGPRIDRYQILEKIGEGGGGIIYLAEQSEPVRKKVALKVIHRGMNTERNMARFEAEHQTLALMNHPNIAQILDAGTTHGGRPYFAMEFVDGVKITEHCDSQRLNVRQRLDLFIQVCHAIQHAHQKGIIHLDIKPSNVLISSQDGLPIPKVIDFGIARATEPHSNGDSENTTYQPFIGTPSYMSPEQVIDRQDADTRSDIYSLGALLYELLTDRPPFDSKRLAQAGVLEVVRILRHEEPPTLTARLAGLSTAELASIASTRSTTPTHLIADIKEDLDWIVIKAMAKDRQTRYETVNGLARDIQRFLDDEPILARPPSKIYPIIKFIQRNKIIVSASAAVALALAIGLATSSWFFFREREARQGQEQLRKTAEHLRANEARLHLQSLARESVSQAALLLAEGKIAEADALLLKTPVTTIEPSLEASNVFRSLGDWNAIRQRWKQAADCYSLLLQANLLNRNSHPNNNLINLIAIGPTLILGGNADGYDHFRNDIIARYQNTSLDPINSSILLKACLLKSCPPELLQHLQPFAKQISDILAGVQNPGLDHYQRAFSALSLALMEYRLGHFQASLDLCRQGLDSPDKNQARSGALHALSALAAHHLDNKDLARSELNNAKTFFIAPFSLDDYYPRGKGQGHWQDWAIARVLILEATAAINAH